MESIHVCEFGLLTTQWYRYFPVHFGKYARKVELVHACLVISIFLSPEQ